MAFDMTKVLRRVKWDGNKRTAKASTRLPAEMLVSVRALHAAGDYETAIDRIVAYTDWESDFQAWRLMGLCLIGLGRHAEAQAAFTEAIECSMLEIVKDEVNSAASMIAEENYKGAEDAAERARQMVPDHPSPIICLLSIYNRMRRVDDVERLLQEIKAQHPLILLHPNFVERVSNDTDLIGIAEKIGNIQPSKS